MYNPMPLISWGSAHFSQNTTQISTEIISKYFLVEVVNDTMSSEACGTLKHYTNGFMNILCANTIIY